VKEKTCNRRSHNKHKLRRWYNKNHPLNLYMLCRRPPLWSSGQSSWLHNGDVVWGTNWIYICYVEESRPPLWSSDQSSWLQIQTSGFNSRRYQIFWEVVGLERDPLSLVSRSEKLVGRKSSGSGPESREYSRRDPPRWPRDTVYHQKLALSSPTSGGRLVGYSSLSESGHGVWEPRRLTNLRASMACQMNSSV
jgi:hypothetical protein